MSRQTPTSKRSPSILVTDVRHQQPHSAPFVSRRLDSVSVDRLLSGTSEVPSARRRVPPPTREPLDRQRSEQNGQQTKSRHLPKVPRLASQPLRSRTSKQSQRLVLIPQEEVETESLPQPDDKDSYARVTAYLVADGFNLKKVAEYLKRFHRARVRLYDEALFADYLLPLLPGDGEHSRAQSSLGDNRTLERMIDISEQGDHHYEYFSGLDQQQTPSSRDGRDDSEFDPSEPQDFSPRPDSSLPPASSPPTDGDSLPPLPEDERRTNNGSNSDDSTKRERWTSHAEMFVFGYGVVVFWNFSESQEKSILADLVIGLEDLAIGPIPDGDIETEDLRFYYTGDDEKPRIFNDVISLSNNNHMIKLAMAHAAAQSTKLCSFEERMQHNMHEVRAVPRTLALTGKLGLNREQLLRISGKLFKLRVDVNLSSNLLDTPEFFWSSEPSLYPLYSALRQYLEIDQRILVVNERCAVFLDLTSILADSIAEFNMDRITVIVIALIVLSICVSLTEIVVRFYLLRSL